MMNRHSSVPLLQSEQHDSQVNELNSPDPASITVAIVTYSPDLDLLASTLEALRVAIDHAIAQRSLSNVKLWIVDNSVDPAVEKQLEGLLDRYWRIGQHAADIIVSANNLGYGRAHNLALERVQAQYHLVLNPDVVVEKSAIHHALGYMQQNPYVGLLTPYAEDSERVTQSLCKRYPSILDLALRGFAPAPMRRLFKKRLGDYELEEVVNSRACSQVPLASGCFMFFRAPVLHEHGGFSSDYFMYFEDFDISMRVARTTSIMYVPRVKIVHFGGGTARKGLKHVLMFLRSGATFFSTFGWKWV